MPDLILTYIFALPDPCEKLPTEQRTYTQALYNNSQASRGRHIRMKRILLADQDTVVGELLSQYVAQPGELSLDWVACCDEAVDLLGTSRYDLVLIALNTNCIRPLLPVEQVMEVAGTTPVALFCSKVSASIVQRFRDMGGAGVILKSQPANSLPHALRYMVSGGRFFPNETLAFEPQDTFGLSRKEIEVLNQLVRGGTNKDIASTLKVAEITIKMHLRSISSKLGTRNRTELAIRGLLDGIVSID